MKNPAVKILLIILLLILMVGGVIAAVFLVRQRQEIRKEASVPGGEATVSLSPVSGTYQLGNSIPVNINFNTAGISVSAIAIRLYYPYIGQTPEITASNIQINSSLLTSGGWSCPVKTVNSENGNVQIDVACVNTNIAGFSTTSNTLLASFNLLVNQTPHINPTILKFDTPQSIITRKTDGRDILLIPTSTGIYTIGSSDTTPTAIPTLTPTPTPTRTPTPTLTLTPILTQTPTPTVTQAPGSTPTPTRTPTPTPTTALAAATSTPTPTVVAQTQATPTMPVSGNLTPTASFLFGGIVLLLGAALFLIF